MKDNTIKRVIVGQIENGADLYDSISRIVTDEDITLGRVTAIGAVKRSRVGYFDQTTLKYIEIDMNEPMEILHLLGNISLKDGKPFVHAHITLSDVKGNVKGGHLLPGGTSVFACEVTIEEIDGPQFHRRPHAGTGLALWPDDTIL